MCSHYVTQQKKIMVAEQTTLAESAFKQIYDLIMSGEIPLGAVVNEVAISQRCQIGRGPVREAVRRLQGLKLLTREPYMRARVVSLSRVDLLEIFQLREAVEGVAARLCAETASDESIAELIRDFESGQPEDAENDRDGVYAFHIRIAMLCGNTRVRDLLCDDLFHLLRLYRMKAGATPGRRVDASEEHWWILRALKSRDPELAERLMRRHIARATALLQGRLGDQLRWNS
jgi:DNA-binding GntR family transcriptional regulator